MTLRLHNYDGTRSLGASEVTEFHVARVGEWIHFHEEDPLHGGKLFRIVSVDHQVRGSTLVTTDITAWEATPQLRKETIRSVHSAEDIPPVLS
jgi:hypothetical protein